MPDGQCHFDFFAVFNITKTGNANIAIIKYILPPHKKYIIFSKCSNNNDTYLFIFSFSLRNFSSNLSDGIGLPK